MATYFTVCIREASGDGTTYVHGDWYESSELAKADAQAQCSEDWGPENYPTESLHVLAVISSASEITVQEWTDTEEL